MMVRWWDGGMVGWCDGARQHLPEREWQRRIEMTERGCARSSPASTWLGLGLGSGSGLWLWVWLGLGLEHLGLEVAVVDGEHVGPQAPPRADDVDDTEPVVRRRPHAGEAVRCEL